MRYLLKRFRHGGLLFFILLGVLLTYSLAEAQVTQKPGEPLIRAFSELFQHPSRNTRLEAYFLSVGLPDRREHTSVLRQQLATADPVERVVILYALAVMTREPSDVDAFLEEFPAENKTFYDLMDAEWQLSNTMNTGIADFLLLLVYETRTQGKAIPPLARIAYNIPVESLNMHLEDTFIREYVEANRSILASDPFGVESTHKRSDACGKAIEALMQSKDQTSRATALLMTYRTPDNSKRLDALINKKSGKEESAAIHRLLVLTKGSASKDFIKEFPEKRQEIEDMLRTEKQLYRPPLRGVANTLWSVVQPGPDENGVMKWQPNKDELRKLRAVLRYGKPYLEAYEAQRLEQYTQGE